VRSNGASLSRHEHFVRLVSKYYVYIMASLSRRLYVGATTDLRRRVWQHKTGGFAFTRRYRVTRLVHFECISDRRAAFVREKQLKGWPRERKCRLIEKLNAGWLDLGPD
jgi:putative endonuclease